MIEKWKPLDVIGPECEISNTGLVRQKVSIVKGVVQYDALRKPMRDERGFLYMAFHGYKKGQQNRYIHRLVAENFIPNPNGYKFLRHGALGRRVNTTENISWVKSPLVLKKKYPLPPKDIALIKALAAKHGMPKKLAAIYKVPVDHIYRIASGRAC